MTKIKITSEAKELYRELCELQEQIYDIENELEKMLWVDNIYEVEWLT